MSNFWLRGGVKFLTALVMYNVTDLNCHDVSTVG